MHNSYGQEETKKVVIVKKIIDNNGNTTMEREEASGKEADALIKKMKEDGTLDGVDIDIDMEIEKAKKSGTSTKSKIEDISIEKSVENGKEMTTYKITTEENGEKNVMIWKSDDGEIPEEMEKILENVDIKTEKSNDGKEVRISIDATGNHDADTEIHKTHTIEKKVVIKHKSDNKVSLGVMIEDDSQGVVISDVVKDSAADKIGLKKGDTILKVDNQYVFNTNMLLESLSKFDKGDNMEIIYLRDGKENKTKVSF